MVSAIERAFYNDQERANSAESLLWCREVWYSCATKISYTSFSIECVCFFYLYDLIEIENIHW